MNDPLDLSLYENPKRPDEHDPNMFGRFYRHKRPVKDADGNFVEFTDEIYIEIRAKGQKNFSQSRPMQEADKKRFAASWKAFTENSSDYVDGTPLSFLPGMGPSEIDNFKASGIMTIEDLANLQELTIDKIRGGRALKARAAAWLAAIAAATKQNMKEAAPKPAPVKNKKVAAK